MSEQNLGSEQDELYYFAKNFNKLKFSNQAYIDSTQKRKEDNDHHEYHEPDGLIGFVRELNESEEALHEPIYLSGEADGIMVECAIQYVNDFAHDG